MKHSSNTDSDRGNPLIDSLADWLIGQALRDAPLETIYERTCKQLFAAGIPVTRGQVAFRVLHPLFNAQSLLWRKGQEIEATN
jgi:adenylate cyclase